MPSRKKWVNVGHIKFTIANYGKLFTCDRYYIHGKCEYFVAEVYMTMTVVVNGGKPTENIQE